MKKALLYVSAACTLLCSCSNTDSPANTQDNGELKALSVSSASMDAFVTRSHVTELTTDGAVIGMFLKDDATSGYTAQANVKYVYAAATPVWGGATATDVIYLNNNNAQVCAYYPYGATVTDASAVALTSQENLVDGSKDLSYSVYNTTDLNNANNTISLTMVHAYAKITFSITRDESYTGTCAVTKIKIADGSDGGKIIPSSSLNITNGTYSDNTPDSVVCALTSTTPVYDGISVTTTPEEAALLLVPVAALDNTTKFTFTVDGNAMSATLNTSSTDILNSLIAGSNYIINVVIKGKGLQIVSVSIADWEDNTNLTDPLEPTLVEP